MKIGISFGIVKYLDDIQTTLTTLPLNLSNAEGTHVCYTQSWKVDNPLILLDYYFDDSEIFILMALFLVLSGTKFEV